MTKQERSTLVQLLQLIDDLEDALPNYVDGRNDVLSQRCRQMTVKVYKLLESETK